MPTTRLAGHDCRTMQTVLLRNKDFNKRFPSERARLSAGVFTLFMSVRYTRSDGVPRGERDRRTDKYAVFKLAR